jgi:hypothetical protein
MTTPAALEWHPNSNQQTRFLSTPAFEALFGGAAGPGKTDCLVMEALRQIAHPKYTGILFRRTFPELEGANGIIQRSHRWYPGYGGKYNDTKHFWRFPSGARVYFGHMEHAGDELTYQGWELAYIAFDELTTFLQKQYLYMLTRCRVPPTSGLRAYVRSATNPGGIGHSWVKTRFITTDIANKIAYFAPVNGKDARVDRDTPDALSRTFIPAKLTDNPDRDPQYAARIRATSDPVQIARLIGGDWDAEYTEGLIYDNWSSIENVSVEADYRPAFGALRWGVDDGYAYGQGPGTESYHPRVILLVQKTPIGGLNVFAEYYATGVSDYNATLDAILGKKDDPNDHGYGYPPPEIAYVDSSAAMFKGAIWQRGIQATGATHTVVEGIKNLRQFICDDNGVRLLQVHPRCENLIREMAQYRNADKGATGGEQRPLKIDDHGPDAIRYVCWPLRYRG